jgi:hypothetical protein
VTKDFTCTDCGETIVVPLNQTQTRRITAVSTGCLSGWNFVCDKDGRWNEQPPLPANDLPTP